MNKNQTASVDDLIDNAINADKKAAIAKMLDKYGLNWNVVKKPMKIVWNDGENGEPVELIDSPNFQVMREDTKQVFWASRDAYEIFQNSQLGELLYLITMKTGYELHGGGSFSDGARVFLQLQTGEERGIGENNDLIKKFLSALNSHDGQTSMRWGITNLTISCSNTFNAAYREMQFAARHTASMKARLDASLKRIEVLNKVEDGMFETFRRMASKPVDPVMMKGLVEKVTGVDITIPASEFEKTFSPYAVKRTSELLDAIAMETEQKGDTAWGLFSGVTRYTSHVMPIGKKENARVESKYVGSGYKADNEAFNFLSN